jgi:aspartate 1-decarboxylase
MEGAFRKVLNAKIHGAVVTDANLAYEGSITIPDDLLQITGLLPNEAVCVWNVTTGARFETYILRGVANSREFHINGAAAHLATRGDTIIIAGFTFLPFAEAKTHNPIAVFLSPDNSIKTIRDERPATLAAV